MIKIYFLIISFIILPRVSLFSQGTNAHKVQAVYIYNFTKYINWKSNDNSFNIGVYGKSDVLNELQTILKGKVVGTRPITVKLLSSSAEIANCDIVYIANDKETEISNIANNVKSKGVLLISENENATKEGACISFVLVSGKLKFKINQKSIQAAGLQVSDALLALGIVE